MLNLQLVSEYFDLMVQVVVLYKVYVVFIKTHKDFKTNFKKHKTYFNH